MHPTLSTALPNTNSPAVGEGGSFRESLMNKNFKHNAYKVLIQLQSQTEASSIKCMRSHAETSH